MDDFFAHVHVHEKAFTTPAVAPPINKDVIEVLKLLRRRRPHVYAYID